MEKWKGTDLKVLGCHIVTGSILITSSILGEVLSTETSLAVHLSETVRKVSRCLMCRAFLRIDLSTDSLGQTQSDGCGKDGSIRPSLRSGQTLKGWCESLKVEGHMFAGVHWNGCCK